MNDESSASAKIRQLDITLKKAIDVAANSLSNTDLDECFGELNGVYGNTLSRLFMNTIAKTQSNVEVMTI